MAKQKALPKIQNGRPLLIQKQESTIATSGPIPDADSLSAYSRVRPDLPDIIIEEWRIEAATRRDLALKNTELAEREVAIREKTANALIRQNGWRMFIGSIFMGGVLLLAWLLIQAGQVTPAIAMTALPAVAAICNAVFKFFKK